MVIYLQLILQLVYALYIKATVPNFLKTKVKNYNTKIVSQDHYNVAIS